MSLLVVDRTTLPIGKLIESFASVKRNLFFYAVTVFESELKWHQVIGLRNGISINKIHFLEDMVIDDSYFDLKGLKIRSLDLDWIPYVWVSDCQQDNRGCSVRGFSVDIVDLVARQLNFTYDSIKEHSCIRSHIEAQISGSFLHYLFHLSHNESQEYLE